MRTLYLHVRDSPTSGAFLLANPKLPLNRMSDAEFADASKIYLGCLPRTPQAVPPRCRTHGCAAAVGAAPAHDLACKCTSGARTSRHHLVTFALHRLFKTYQSMMGDVPQVEPFVSTYYRAPAEANAPAIPLPARRKENQFDAAVRFGDRTYLIDYIQFFPLLFPPRTNKPRTRS
jgi:hypothetical protein